MPRAYAPRSATPIAPTIAPPFASPLATPAASVHASGVVSRVAALVRAAAVVLSLALVGSVAPAAAVSSPAPVWVTPQTGASVRPSAAVPSGADWVWPVDAAREVLRPYAAPATQFAAGHRGIDIRATTSVYAPDDGVVSFVGFVVDRPVVSISHNRGLVSSFEPVIGDVGVGDLVRRGQPVGSVATSVHSDGGIGSTTSPDGGSTTPRVGGHCGENCLHFGVRQNGEYLSPLALFGPIPPAVLLPTREDAL